MKGAESFRNYCYFVTIIVFLCLNSCGGGGGATGAGFDALSDAESGLYESGPADIPVTIAKLESPDQSKIIVSADSNSNSINVFPTLIKYSTTNPTVAYTITGAAGAIYDQKETPYVYLWNSNNGVEEYAGVNSDGSFSIAILGDLSDKLYLASSTTADSNTTQVSPPLEIQVDSLGVVAISDTNSTNISADFSVATDNSGNYYLVVVNSATNKSNFYRRNTNGTFLQTIWTENDLEASIIPTKIEAVGSSFIYVVDQKGYLHQIQVAETSSSISSSFLTGRSPLFTLTTSVSDVTKVNEVLEDGDPAAVDGYRLQIVYDGSDPRNLIFYYPQDSATNDSLGVVLYLDDTHGLASLTSSLEDSEIIPRFKIDDMVVAYGTSGDGIAIITDTGVDGCSASAPCLGEIIRDEENWDSEEYNDMYIKAYDASIPKNIVSLYPSTLDPNYYYLITSSHVWRYSNFSVDDNDPAVQISFDYNPTSLVMSQDGTYLFGCCENGVICAYDEDENDFAPFQASAYIEEGVCDSDNPPDIDTSNNVHYYNALGQHSNFGQSANSDGDRFSLFVRRPPRALGACGYEVTESLTSSKFNDFCECWIDYNDISTSTSCSTYYSKCQSAGKTADMGECFYYLRDKYDELSVGF